MTEEPIELKRTSEDFQRHIHRVVDYLLAHCFLRDHRYQIKWMDNEEKPGKSAESTTVFEVVPCWPYSFFTLIVYKPAADRFYAGDDHVIFRILVHEFIHILLAPYTHSVSKMPEISTRMRDVLDDHEEALCERLSTLVYWGVKAKVEKFRPEKEKH